MIKILQKNNLAMMDGTALLHQTLENGKASCPQLHPFLVELHAIKHNTVTDTLYLSSCNTPFAPMFVCTNQAGDLYSLEFGHEALNFEQWSTQLHGLMPHAHWEQQPNIAQGFADQLFPKHPSVTRPKQPLNVHIEATPFQLDIWNLLLHLPVGCVTNYRNLANRNGTPNASRALGTALGNNRVGYLIPCHRVLSVKGTTTGFRWGTALKEALLDWEFECVTPH